MSYPTPSNEADRLRTLHGLHILDTDTEAPFDDIVELAQHLFDVSKAAVSFIAAERQWFKRALFGF